MLTGMCFLVKIMPYQKIFSTTLLFGKPKWDDTCNLMNHQLWELALISFVVTNDTAAREVSRIPSTSKLLVT